MARRAQNILGRLTSQSDIIMAMAVVGIVLILVIPTAPGMLDILLTFNITFALVILLTTLYITKPLELSVFPSMLLVVTPFILLQNFLVEIMAPQ